MSEGWTCPKCGRVWSPSTIQCWTCNQAKDRSSPACADHLGSAFDSFRKHGAAIAKACEGGRE